MYLKISKELREVSMSKVGAFQVCVVCPACGEEIHGENSMSPIMVNKTDICRYDYCCDNCLLRFSLSFNVNSFCIADKMVCDYIKKI